MSTELAEVQKQAGHDSLFLWCAEQNKPAWAFYTALGGVEVGTRLRTFGSADIGEVAYGWPDITVLEGNADFHPPFREIGG